MAVAQPHFTRMKNVDYRYLEAVCLDQHRLAHFVGRGDWRRSIQFTRSGCIKILFTGYLVFYIKRSLLSSYVMSGLACAAGLTLGLGPNCCRLN